MPAVPRRSSTRFERGLKSAFSCNQVSEIWAREESVFVPVRGLRARPLVNCADASEAMKPEETYRLYDFRHLVAGGRNARY